MLHFIPDYRIAIGCFPQADLDPTDTYRGKTRTRNARRKILPR